MKNRTHRLPYILGILLLFTCVEPVCAAYVHKGDRTDTLRLSIDSVLTISKGHQPLLTYQFNTVYPPHGQDTSYRRSGFIHPVNTLKGQRLTRIQPDDHYHHYGIWNPWTHTLFRGDTVDFWNLYKKTGTVRFVCLQDYRVDAREAEYTTFHHHVVLKDDGSEEVALHEWQTVSVHLPEGREDYYWIDITIKMRCATAYPLRLLSYRYGGLGWPISDSTHPRLCASPRELPHLFDLGLSQGLPPNPSSS